MDRQYWIDRKHAAMALARGAATSEARLFHYESAGRCAVRAVRADALAQVGRGGPGRARP